MKMRFYSLIMRGCDLACLCLHKLEAVFRAIRDKAWLRCTAENLKTCQNRVTRFHL